MVIISLPGLIPLVIHKMLIINTQCIIKALILNTQYDDK